MIRLRSQRGRIAAAFALAAMLAAVVYAASGIVAFLVHEGAEEATVAPEDLDEERTENLEIASKIAVAMGLVAPLVAVCAAALGWWLSGKALAPLREAAERAEAARAGDRELLLPVRGHDDEWDRLAAIVNDLIRNQRTATDRARSFSANAAHELRTPIAAILGHVQVMLRRERSVDEYRAVLSGVASEAARLGALVEVLLTLARADSGELRARSSDFDLAEVVADAAARRLAPPAELRLDVSPARAHGDPVLTRRVLDNLLDNALRHGAPPFEVRVWGRDDVVLASVTDGGQGLPASVRARLFERFNREPGAPDGFGLGLAIAQALAAAQGGRVRLDASVTGTRFVLELPRAAAERAGRASGSSA